MQEQNNIMEKIMKNISILGSTGSIGTQTLDIVRANNDLNVVAIAAGSNVKMLEEQIREFHPKLVCVYNEEAAGRLKTAVADTDVKVVAGMDGLIEAATYNSAQIVVTAFVGMIGIRPTLEAIKAGKDIALANKETLVTAGHLVMEAAKEYGVKILPVDSEHSAIFQSLNGENKKEIDKILLTASGGPFRGWTREQMKNVQV
jgi:1-deoxy-D-xylulose-5-phosphate reductoisomerase